MIHGKRLVVDTTAVGKELMQPCSDVFKTSAEEDNANVTVKGRKPCIRVVSAHVLNCTCLNLIISADA